MAYQARLESACSLLATVGSNPTLSATVSLRLSSKHKPCVLLKITKCFRLGNALAQILEYKNIIG